MANKNLTNAKKAKNNEPEAMDEIGFYKLEEFPPPLHPALKQVLKIHHDLFTKYSAQ